MDPTKIIGLIIGLFTLLAIVGVVIVYLKGTVADGTIASLERSNAAFKEELEATKITHLRERAEDQAVIRGLQTQIGALKLKGEEQDRTIDILKNVVTNADEVKAISVMLGTHHTATTEQLRLIELNLRKLVVTEGDRHGDPADT